MAGPQIPHGLLEKMFPFPAHCVTGQPVVSLACTPLLHGDWFCVELHPVCPGPCCSLTSPPSKEWVCSFNYWKGKKIPFSCLFACSHTKGVLPYGFDSWLSIVCSSHSVTQKLRFEIFCLQDTIVDARRSRRWIGQQFFKAVLIYSAGKIKLCAPRSLQKETRSITRGINNSSQRADVTLAKCKEEPCFLTMNGGHLVQWKEPNLLSWTVLGKSF